MSTHEIDPTPLFGRSLEESREALLVHVLNLHGWSDCTDLPAEFAQGPARSPCIERTDDRIIVSAPTIDRAAQFDLAALTEGPRRHSE